MTIELLAMGVLVCLVSYSRLFTSQISGQNVAQNGDGAFLGFGNPP